VIEGGIYHIIQLGNNFEPIFAEDGDRLYFLHLLKDCRKKFGIEIFAFCLLDNHIHILIRLLKSNLSEGMHWLFMSYAKKFTERYRRKGHLFTSRFKSILCLNDTYFLRLSRYIHLNPVEAGIIKSPFSYRWSSCNLFTKLNMSKKSFVNIDFTLALFSNDKYKASKAYKEFIIEGAQKKDFKYPSLIAEGILGDMEDLFKFNDKLSHFTELRELIKMKNYKEKDKKCGDYLKSRKRKKVASRDYLIYQKKKQGTSYQGIAKEMKVSLRTVARAIKRIENWQRTCQPPK